MCYGQRTDNPEGQVTYPIIADRTAGLPTGSGTSFKMYVAFLSSSYFNLYEAPYGATYFHVSIINIITFSLELEVPHALFPIKDPTASNGVSSLQRCRAARYWSTRSISFAPSYGNSPFAPCIIANADFVGFTRKRLS